MISIAQQIESTAERALAKFPQLQTWPTHFRRRSLEMQAIARVYDFGQARRTLELGCGNAVASALIAAGREQVVATDLFRPDVNTHSIDLRTAKRLLSGLGLERCAVAGATGDALPFASGSFDLVFSLFVLEHVPNRPACLREIRRVLGPGGLTVHGVPGAMWAVPAPIRFPIYLVRRVLARIVPRSSRPSAAGAEAWDDGGGLDGDAPKKLTFAEFRRRYPAFPLPRPHGEYASYLEELSAYRRTSWVALFEQEGFEVVACVPLTILSPDLLLRVPGRRVARILRRFDEWLSSLRALRAFGQFFIIVGRPAGESCP